jgi:hypothetical protein
MRRLPVGTGGGRPPADASTGGRWQWMFVRLTSASLAREAPIVTPRISTFTQGGPTWHMTLETE